MVAGPGLGTKRDAVGLGPGLWSRKEVWYNLRWL